MSASRQQRKAQAKAFQKMPSKFVEVPSVRWPKSWADNARIAVWQNNKYLVQVFKEPGDIFRLSVNRLVTGASGWKANIPWEDLQAIKNEIGFSEQDAVEVYPREEDEVNMANMRHLWIMPTKLRFAWRKHKLA